MASLITVLACDDCEKTIGLKTDEDWTRFNEIWADSLRHQFCPDCKEKIANRAKMEMDLQFIERVVAKADKDEWSEFIN